MRTTLREMRATCLTLCLYLVIYVTVDRISAVHALPGIGITLWNPGPAFSLALLLMKGLRFAPALLVAAVVSDGLNGGFSVGLATALVMDVMTAVGYTLIAAALRPFAGPESDLKRLRDMVGFLGVVCVGVLALAGLTGGVLVLFRMLPAEQFLTLVRHYWIGDVSGIIGLFPVLKTAPFAWKRWKACRGTRGSSSRPSSCARWRWPSA